ncbi:MAG: hypothetical protein JXB45_01135 [Candidatus Krumholzibacteriota bacterium]|nr:hypothetical protein [Candidatus Krumholzibacteriota bacterium]
MLQQQTEVRPPSREEAGSALQSGPFPGGGEEDLLRLLKSCFQNVDQGVILLDARKNFLFANKCSLSILAAESERVVAGIIERNCPESLFDRGKEKKSVITYLDLTLPGRDSRKLLGLEIHYLESPDDSNFMILVHDFSKWKKLDELRSRFATSLSHRMRTPLTAIRNAVKILSEKDHPLSPPEKEKLLEIGWRNVEKLITNLDELQKIFMIESEELNVCRTLIKVKNEIKPLLNEMEKAGKIRGIKLSMPDMTVCTGGGRLRDFVETSVEAYTTWLGEAPFIECSSSVKEEFLFHGGIERKFKIYLRPRTGGWFKTARESLKDFLTLQEAHRGLVLGRLATALDAEMEISPGNTISLILPLDPPYNREKDLVHPLHMMIERADILGAEFYLVGLRMVGSVGSESRFANILEKCLCQKVNEEYIAARDEEPQSYSLFILNKDNRQVKQMMRDMQEHFLSACRHSGEEIYPSLHWDIRYNRLPGLFDCPLGNILSGDYS